MDSTAIQQHEKQQCKTGFRYPAPLDPVHADIGELSCDQLQLEVPQPLADRQQHADRLINIAEMTAVGNERLQ